jgi:thiol:disulfide interchange protein DsbD
LKKRLATATAYLAVFCCMINFIFVPVGMLAQAQSQSGLAPSSAFEEPLQQGKLQAAQVVRFRLLSMTTVAQGGAGAPSQATKVTISFETRAGFKIYDKGLEFRARPQVGEEWLLSAISDPPPLSAQDPWYDEIRSTHASGAVFTLTSPTVLGAGDAIRIRFEACSVSMCLLPVWFELAASEGSVAVLAERAVRSVPEFAPAASQSIKTQQAAATAIPQDTISAAPPSSMATANPPEVSSKAVVSFADRVALFVQEALTGRSPWLFPALLVAGLLMNLTPCVYPMIPITLNVLGRLGRHAGAATNDEEEHWSEGVLRAAIYVLGIILTYSVMGVVAGMTGTLFGSLLQSQAVLMGLALLFIVLGFAMLGIIDFTKVQVWASRIPISEKSPHIGVFTMGAVSGLVSAPCTGPVLSALLILIGKSQDPLYGFALMSFFSLGFGLPYLVLGVFAHNLKRVPRVGALLDFIKVFFAALLFGLALYYLKAILAPLPVFDRIYANPGAQGLALCFATAVIFWLLGKQVLQKPLAGASSNNLQKGRKAGMARLGLILSMTQMSLWLSLFVTNGFVIAKTADAGEPSGAVPTFRWQTDWRIAVATAKGNSKGLIVDAWAQWCAACLKMDAELWADPEVMKKINEGYVPLKLDFTESTPFTDEIASRWDIVGLPAVGIFPAGSDFEALPPKLFRAAVSKAELFAAFDSLKAVPSADTKPK